MPVSPTITQYCAVALSTPHSDGTPSYIVSQPTYIKPVAGIALETAASGSTIDIASMGAIVSNAGWAFTPAELVYVADVSGNLSTTKPTGSTSAYNVAGLALDATTLYVWPQRTIIDAGAAVPGFVLSAANGLKAARLGDTDGLAAKQRIGFGAVATTTPTQIGDLVAEVTNDTTVTIKLKGSDGTVRSVALTLA